MATMMMQSPAILDTLHNQQTLLQQLASQPWSALPTHPSTDTTLQPGALNNDIPASLVALNTSTISAAASTFALQQQQQQPQQQQQQQTKDNAMDPLTPPSATIVNEHSFGNFAHGTIPPPSLVQHHQQQQARQQFQPQQQLNQRPSPQAFSMMAGGGGFQQPQQPQQQKQRACLDWMRDGMCEFGERCIFSHTDRSQEVAMKRLHQKHRQELVECQMNGKYRTRVCKHWLVGRCTFGAQCKFAHGDTQMRGLGFTSFPVYGMAGQVIGMQNIHGTEFNNNPPRGPGPRGPPGRFPNHNHTGMMGPQPHQLQRNNAPLQDMTSGLTGMQQPRLQVPLAMAPVSNAAAIAVATAAGQSAAANGGNSELDPFFKAALAHATSTQQRDHMLHVYQQALEKELASRMAVAPETVQQQQQQQHQQSASLDDITSQINDLVLRDAQASGDLSHIL